GTFEFGNGYPTADATDRLYELRLINRAVEAYLASIPAVSMLHMRNGTTEVGVDPAAKFVISRPCSTPGAWSGGRRWQAIRRGRHVVRDGATRDGVSLRV